MKQTKKENKFVNALAYLIVIIVVIMIIAFLVLGLSVIYLWFLKWVGLTSVVC